MPRHAKPRLRATDSLPDPNKEVIRPNPGPQTAFLSTVADIALFGGGAGGGKALSVHEPIPTPSGWTKMGNLKAGDAVFGADGKACTVVGAYNYISNPDAYRIVFDDGTSIECNADHRWLTFTRKELGQLAQRNPEWRAARRAKRASRISWRKTVKFSLSLMARNRLNPPPTKPPPAGVVRTTAEIAETLLDRRGGRNHAVPVAKPLDLPRIKLPLDPYLLGAWLGDGSAHAGEVSGLDAEVFQAFESEGFVVSENRRGGCTKKIEGLRPVLASLGVIGNKHVPPRYLRASARQRLELLRGLMDTDGTASKSGSVSFTNTNYRLICAARELVVSLGWKCSVVESRARLYGKDCGPVWDVFFAPTESVFRIKRKAARERLKRRPTGKYRYIVSCQKCPPSLMRCIAVDGPGNLYLAGPSMVPTHNTFGLLMEAMRHSDNPDYRATIFRRTLKQITKQGSLWDSSEELYPRTGATSNLNSLTWRWRTGAEVQMAGIEYEKSVENYLGAQIDMMGFDELYTFSRRQFVWLISRNRGRAGILPYVRATTNPDADSWVAEWVKWYVHPETGYPIKSRSGKIRWLVVINDKVHWGDTRDELIDRFGPDALPKSFTFIPALLDDNPKLVEKNPQYRSNLRMLSTVENLRLEKGNWKVRAEAGKVFSRSWFKSVTEIPKTGPGARGEDCRFFDLAATEKQQKGDDPDFTVGVLCRKVGAAYYFLDCVAVQESPAEVEQLMLRTSRADAERARRDHCGYRLRWELEPGSASIREAARLAGLFSGLDARAVTPREHGATGGKWDKIARATALAAQARAGNVFVCPAAWSATDQSLPVDEFLAEMHGFPDRPHNDVPDAASASYNCLPNFLNPGSAEFVVGPQVMPAAWQNW